jgi:hypothetical protein
VIERDQLRQQKARPILESIKSQIETAKGQTLPKSALAKACNYTLTFWNRLTRFLNHSILELSTNAAENAIRPVALGAATICGRYQSDHWSPSQYFETRLAAVGMIALCSSTFEESNTDFRITGFS